MPADLEEEFEDALEDAPRLVDAPRLSDLERDYPGPSTTELWKVDYSRSRRDGAIYETLQLERSWRHHGLHPVTRGYQRKNYRYQP